MRQRISTEHALCSVLAPPIIPTTKTKPKKKPNKKRRKEVFLNLQMKDIAEDQGVGYQWAASEHITKGSMGAS